MSADFLFHSIRGYSTTGPQSKRVGSCLTSTDEQFFRGTTPSSGALVQGDSELPIPTGEYL